MVGGEVKEALILADRVWINAKDRHYTDECAIYVVRNDHSEQIRRGDAIWWQARFAMWTPQEKAGRPVETLRCGIDFDIQIPRIGYSGVDHPAQHLVEQAYAE